LIMSRYQDVTGIEFGFLTPLRYLRTVKKMPIWLCRCRCGAEIEAKAKQLKDGKRKYCDTRKHIADWCPRSVDNPSRVHRLTWVSWSNMRSRCRYESVAHWRNYGGRGIKVCDRWQNFEVFLSDMGERPSASYSIERKDVDGDYEPGNCVWATRRQQSLNRRDTVWVEWGGDRRKFLDVCREVGADEDLVRSRLKTGWTIGRAFSLPRHVVGEKLDTGVGRGRPRSPQRVEVDRLLGLGWSVDAIASHLGARRQLVLAARKEIEESR
jgi:hypothetical protein